MKHLMGGCVAARACQEKLNLAAKARIRRMVAPHKKRKDLGVSEAVVAKWNEGPDAKNLMAQVLAKVNFDRVPRKVFIKLRQANPFHMPCNHLHDFIGFACAIVLCCFPGSMVVSLHMFKSFGCKGRGSAQQTLVFASVLIQESFLRSIETLVRRERTTELIIDEAWYSEYEMEHDLKWSKYFG